MSYATRFLLLIVISLAALSFAQEAAMEGDAEENAPKARPKVDYSKIPRHELYRLTFKKSAPERLRNFTVHLFSEGRRFGNTEIFYDASFRSFTFVNPAFSRFLDSLTLPEERVKADGTGPYRGPTGPPAPPAPQSGQKPAGPVDKAAPSGMFSSDRLISLGYGVEINERNYELHVSVPPQIRKQQHIRLNGGVRPPPSGSEEIRPAYVSFYANVRVDDYFRYTTYDHGERARFGYCDSATLFRDPATATLDGALNVMGWALESSARLLEPLPGQPVTWEYFRRGDARLVREIAPWLSRITIGDVYGGSNLTGGETMGGARYEYNDRFFGNNPGEGRDTISFFLRRAGYVEVHVDGQYRRGFHLPPGYHQISGFDGRPGPNVIHVWLYPADGHAERLWHKFTYGDSRNMLKGEKRFSAAAGLRRYTAPSPECYWYNLGEPGVSVDASYGMGHFVTTEAAGQFSPYNRVIGGQISLSFDTLGWLEARSTMNYADSSRLGGRAEISYGVNSSQILLALYRWLLDDKDAYFRFSQNSTVQVSGYLQSAFYNPGFFSGDVAESNVYGGVTGSLTFSLPNGSFSANGGIAFKRPYDDGYDEAYTPRDYRCGLRVSQRVYRVSLSAGAGVDVSDGRSSPYFSLNGAYSFGLGRHRFSTSAGANLRTVYVPPSIREIEYPDSVLDDPNFNGPLYEEVGERDEYQWTGNAALGWNWSNGRSNNGSKSYSASVGAGDRVSGSASARHVYNRADLSAGYGFSDYEELDSYRQNHTLRASLGTSLMFADGLWAVGRPVQNGFILARTKGNLRGAKLHIGNSGRSELSRSGPLGAAYQNRVGSLNPTEMRINISGAKSGAMPEQNKYYANGGYKRGYALRVGGSKSVLMQMRLTDGGAPLRHTYVSVEQEIGAGKGKKSVQPERRATFTNANGVLQLGGLKPGATYRIKFSPSTYIKDMLIKIPNRAAGIIEMPGMEAERE